MVINAKEVKKVLMYAVFEKRQDISNTYISCKSTGDKFIQLSNIFADENSAKFLQVTSKEGQDYNISLNEEVVIYAVQK